MALVLALVAKHLADILVFRILAVQSIVMLLASMSISLGVSIASLESTIVIMMLVVTSSTLVIPMFVTMVHIRSRVSLE